MIGIGYRIPLWCQEDGAPVSTTTETTTTPAPPTTTTTTTTTSGYQYYQFLGDWRFGDKDSNFAVDYNVPPWTTIFEV